ncbi:response regulator transcription factor [Tepidibacter hydrothermalis]|uniref:Stage 0 sporulation protein A homolog n=1 Tax=Tepidibacter hydrothermalis TaxID=3036126 RepID=A0ABY8EAZ2_9FIRM|nr:response regulator transcription factor [Tepidibacter hydrothermalis]WFD10074.1 response regulator transcription factor [Tepidibacter hydrothermalis]
MKPYKILIIEDEEKIARFVELELQYEGYEVNIKYNGRDGLKEIEEGNYDLVILDIMLPGINGMEVCRRVRRFSDIPIIMLTAKDQVEDKVMGLDLGANDYLTKPFAIEELLARIRGSLRRFKVSNKDSNIMKIKNLTMDADKYEVKVEEDIIDLTKREYELLEYLIKNKQLVLPRVQILEAVWGYDYSGDTNVVDVYIRYLRSKIDDKYNEKYIHTVRGVGYVIKDE